MAIKAVDATKPSTMRSPQDHSRAHIGEHIIADHPSLSKASLGKAPLPKGRHAVGIHNGMTEQQHNVAGLGGLAHETSTAIDRADQAESCPLSPLPGPGKQPTPVKAAFGQRSTSRLTDEQMHNLGRAILDQAVKT